MKARRPLAVVLDDESMERAATRDRLARIRGGEVTSLVVGSDDDGHYLVVEGTSLLDVTGDSIVAVLRAFADRIERGT